MKLPLAIALALSTGSAAFAQEASVRYADLNLSQAAGQTELDRRIEAAAKQVCRVQARTGTRIIDQREVKRCTAEVRAQAESQLPR